MVKSEQLLEVAIVAKRGRETKDGQSQYLATVTKGRSGAINVGAEIVFIGPSNLAPGSGQVVTPGIKSLDRRAMATEGSTAWKHLKSLR